MTSTDKQRRLWDWYFGTSVSRAERSIYGGDDPSSAFALYNDGGGITLAMPFSTVGASNPECIGGRVWIPSIEPNHTAQVRIMMWDGLDLAQEPVRQAEVVTSLGWTEGRWEPFTVVNGAPFAVGYQFIGSVLSGNYYVHSPNERVAGVPTVSPSGRLQINVTPALFMIGSSVQQSNDTTSYGLDALVMG
jgi:hypothetical protein